jgi:hypothetical protein
VKKKKDFSPRRWFAVEIRVQQMVHVASIGNSGQHGELVACDVVGLKLGRNGH